jgi:hypothetical protein
VRSAEITWRGTRREKIATDFRRPKIPGGRRHSLATRVWPRCSGRPSRARHVGDVVLARGDRRDVALERGGERRFLRRERGQRAPIAGQSRHVVQRPVRWPPARGRRELQITTSVAIVLSRASCPDSEARTSEPPYSRSRYVGGGASSPSRIRGTAREKALLMHQDRT